MSQRSVTVYIGTSLDGYIATKDDSLEWLLNTPGDGDNGFGEFYNTVDTVIMGRRTYDWILEHDGVSPYPDKEVYVYTRGEHENHDNITFTSEDISALIHRLKEKNGGRIWIVGGAEVIKICRENKLIDEYILSISPVILGEGISLFAEGVKEELKLFTIKNYGEFAELHYIKKN
ncbi:MAG: dihydrofolate reductase family protein [Clostridia bacterium]|nr:dihydrofolate reductase family protein [Clostridia bacterium]